MKIIINADDLGLTKESNYGILKAFERGYVTQTTLIVNSEGAERVRLLHIIMVFKTRRDFI